MGLPGNEMRTHLREAEGIGAADAPPVLPATLDPAFVADLLLMRDLLPELTETFQRDVRVRFAQIREAISANEPDVVTKTAHGIKGAAGGIGGREMAEACRRLEYRGKSGDLTGASELLAEAEREFASVVLALTDLMRE